MEILEALMIVFMGAVLFLVGGLYRRTTTIENVIGAMLSESPIESDEK